MVNGKPVPKLPSRFGTLGLAVGLPLVSLWLFGFLWLFGSLWLWVSLRLWSFFLLSSSTFVQARIRAHILCWWPLAPCLARCFFEGRAEATRSRVLGRCGVLSEVIGVLLIA